jgi:DNA ligase D-like protein (predicted polymerase)
MPASEATTVDAGGRELRVSSADRVIFPATERTGEVTKLDVVNYYLAVGDGIMRALARRPTTLERWPKGVHPGIVVSTRERGGGDAFFQKRIPRGAPDYVRTARIQFPSGRHADEICPTEVAVVGWAAQMGTITFHPWPVRDDDVDHPDELRLDLDPQPGTDFADAVRVAAEARVLLGELGYTGFPKTSGGRGVHIYVRIEPRWTFTDVRHAAIAFGRELERRLPGQVTTNWWKEERGERIFVDYNQNARDRTIASAYSVRPKPGAPVSAPVTWDELAAVAPEDFTVATMPARFADVGDRHAAIDDTAHSLQPLLDLYERDEATGKDDMPYPPDYPKMPGEPKRVQPSRDRDRPRDRGSCGSRATCLKTHQDGGACGSFLAPRLSTGADGGGTTGPMSPSGASSRSTITGAWSLGPLPLRAWRSTHAARTRSATGPPASTRSMRIPRSWWNIPAR